MIEYSDYSDSAARWERCYSTLMGKCGCGLVTNRGRASLARIGHMAYECDTCYEARRTVAKLNDVVNGDGR